MGQLSHVVWQAHARLPNDNAKATDISVANVTLDADDVLINAKLEGLPCTSDSLTLETADGFVVLIQDYHCLHVVRILPCAYGNFPDFLAISQYGTLLNGHLGPKRR